MAALDINYFTSFMMTGFNTMLSFFGKSDRYIIYTIFCFSKQLQKQFKKSPGYKEAWV